MNLPKHYPSLISLVAVSTGSLVAPVPTSPVLTVVMADDLGNADVGFNRSSDIERIVAP